MLHECPRNMENEFWKFWMNNIVYLVLITETWDFVFPWEILNDGYVICESNRVFFKQPTNYELIILNNKVNFDINYFDSIIMSHTRWCKNKSNDPKSINQKKKNQLFKLYIKTKVIEMIKEKQKLSKLTIVLKNYM